MILTKYVQTRFAILLGLLVAILLGLLISWLSNLRVKGRLTLLVLGFISSFRILQVFFISD